MFNRDEAFEKIKHYCRYQERSHREVKEKLYSFGLYKGDVEQILTQLIEEDYLNEERFAVQFAGGKFRIKHWGRVKIKHELQQKGISSYCIKMGLKEIEEETYLQTLKKLATKKWQTLETEQYLTKQAKITSYLLHKGYEAELVRRVVAELKAA
jgi:regulatory protein